MTRRPSVPVLLVVVAAVAAIVFATAATVAPARYDAWMQEDRLVEWATVWLFGAAAVIGGRSAWRERRWFDLLVALFALFVAGEEMSWGQRLIGFTPPEAFLAHNTQQEANLHNFAGVIGRPKWSLVLALLGYGLLLPVAARVPGLSTVVQRVRATPPAVPVAATLVAIALLLVWYPFSFTGEWAEFLAGLAFLAAARPGVPAFAVNVLGSLVFGALLAWWSARALTRGPDARLATACAASEAQGLVSTLGFAADDDLLEPGGGVHKRVWTLVLEGWVDTASVRATMADRPCAGLAASTWTTRRRYAVDPWGTAYWAHASDTPEGRRLAVYSFGPNRRRDGVEGRAGGDDVVAEAIVAAP